MVVGHVAVKTNTILKGNFCFNSSGVEVCIQLY